MIEFGMSGLEALTGLVGFGVIVVGTHGPKLELLRAQERISLAALQKKYPHDADVVRLVQLDHWNKALITALTANNDVTFDAVFTETTIS